MSVELFKKEAPDVLDAYFNMIKVLESRCPLDPKVRELVLIAILTAKESLGGLPVHIERAKKNGATESEILTVIISALPSCGMGTVLKALDTANKNL